MKKIIAVLLMIAMVLTFAACGAKEEAPAVEEKAPAVEETPAEKAPEEAPAEKPADPTPAEEGNDDPYYFGTKGIEIRIMDEAAGVLSALGDPLQTFEADSCAFQGKDYFYYYDGFQLMVNDVDGVERITSITMVDDTVEALNGLRIGSSEEDIAAKIGEDYTSASNMYVYRHDTTTLQISVQGGKVSAIVYAYAVAN